MVQKDLPQALAALFNQRLRQWASIGRTAAAELKAGRLSARFGHKTLIAKSEAERWLVHCALWAVS